MSGWAGWEEAGGDYSWKEVALLHDIAPVDGCKLVVGVLLVAAGPDLAHKPAYLLDVPRALLLLSLEHAEEEHALDLVVYEAARDADPKHDGASGVPADRCTPGCTSGTSRSAHRQDLRARWIVATPEHHV